MKKELFILILVLIVLVLLWYRRQEGYQTNEIPKIIWTYWDSEDMPKIVKKSIESWRRYNPDWTINVVTPKTLGNFLPNLDIKNFRPGDFVQRKVDLIRLHLIAEYGGVWSDATIVVKKSYDWVIDLQKVGGYDFIGYYREASTTNKDYPVIENWLFAAPPKSEIVMKWRDEYAKVGDYKSITDYIEDVKKRGVDLQDIPDPGYLTPYVSIQCVLQKELTKDEIRNKIKVIKSDDGPFKHSQATGWDAAKSMKWLCDQPETEVPDVVKIYGNERRALEADPKLNCVYKIFD